MLRRRFRSTSSARRRLFSLLSIAALLSGALLAWALPALAHTGGHRSDRSRLAAARRSSTPSRTSTTSKPSPAHPGTATSTTASATATSTTGHPSTTTTPKSWVGRWSPTFSLSGAIASDLIAPILGVSAQDTVAVGSGVTNEDAPQRARADIITGTASDAFFEHALSKIQQTLAVGYLGKRVVALIGSSPLTDACCSVASAVSYNPGGGLSGAEQFATGLEGTTTGNLVPVHGGLLAAVDNQAGITVARSDAKGDFGAPKQLVPSDPTPPLMAASSLTDGGAVVVWTAPETTAETVTGTTTTPGESSTTAGYDQPTNELIDFAVAGPSGLPGAAKLAVTVPNGHEIDALAVTEHGSGATIAWTESWFTGSSYDSQVFWADLKSSAHIQKLSAPSTDAVGVSLASSSGGRQVLAWQACDIGAGTCTADAALRPHGQRWGRVRVLGAADPTSFPVASESSLGQPLVGWISDGNVEARSAKPGTTAFYPAARLSDITGATDLALGFGAGQDALAVWIQGTVDQRLVGARFSP